MINFDKIFHNLGLLHGAAQDVVTPFQLVRKIVAQMPASEFDDPDRTFLDPCCGKGTFLIAVAERAFYAMEKLIPDPQARIQHIVSRQLYGVDSHPGQVRTTITTLKKLAGADVNVNISIGDSTLMHFDKKFDNIIGNPPYNISDKKTGNGTGGDVTLYKKFYKISRRLVRSGGNIALITPKGIIPVLAKDKLNVTTLNLMTDNDYWKYNTCYFIAKNEKSNNGLAISDSIIKKLFELNGNPNWYELNGKPNKKKISYAGSDAISAIVKLGTEKTKPSYGTVDPKWKKLLGTGPKLAATLLENKHSYLVTNDPICAEFCGVYQTKTIVEAEKLKLFIENSELLRHIQRRLKTKGLFWTFRHLKPFDLSQIITGHEIPVEWNLSAADLKELAK